MKTCVLVFSIGNRAAYLKLTKPFFEDYCNRTNSQLEIVLTLSIPLLLKMYFAIWPNPIRPTAAVQYQRMLAVGQFLKKYDKVILMDDTCIVDRKTPDLSAVVPDDKIGALDESKINSTAYKIDKEFIFKKRKISISKYFNGGVVVIPKQFQKVFSPNNLWKQRDLFASYYVEQAFLAYSIAKTNIPVHCLPEAYNFMHLLDYHNDKNRTLKSLPEKHLAAQKEIFIHHITGYYQNRQLIIQQICEYLNQLESKPRPL